MSDLALLNTLLLVVEVALASLILPPMGWLLARTYRKSAAGRRLAWIVVFAMLLALPLLALALPSVAVIALPAPPPPDPAYVPAYVPAPAAEAATPAPMGFSWTALIPLAGAVWLAGLAKIGVEHLVGLIRLELMRRSARPWRGPLPIRARGCQILMSDESPGPMTWGVFRPVIMLPDEALDWPEARLEAALRHELAHVHRRDGLVQALSMAACAVYWPNPLVWLAAKALRREAELAADDTVIAAGVRPSDYASQLVELAAEWRERRLTPTGLAMAAPPALTRRVQSILSTDANRSGATAMDILKLALLGGVATAGLTLARPSLAEIAGASPASSPASQAQVAASRSDSDRDAAVDTVEEESARPRALARSSAPQSTELAQQSVPAPPTVAAAPLPPLPAAPPVPNPPGDHQIPYNQVTDDPASPGYIPPGQPGAQHPVPAELAKRLNARKDPAAPWTLSWCPAGTACPQPPAPPGPAAAGAKSFELTWLSANGAPPPVGAPLPPLPGAPGAVTIFGDSTGNGSVNVHGRVYNFRGMTAEQRAELERKLAAIGPAVNKAIADAHIDETVQKALASQDPKIREAVAKQLADIGPRIQSAVAAARMQEDMQQRLAQIPQYQEAMKKMRARQADAEDRAAARLEEQAKRARERAKRDRDSLSQPAQPSQTPKN